MLFLRRSLRLLQLSIYRRCLSSKALSSKKPEIDVLSKLRDWCIMEERQEFIVPPFKKALQFAHDTAIRDYRGEYSYLQLYITAKKLSVQISNICGGAASRHVACLCAPNVLSTMTQWACWMSGQVFMLLNVDFSIELIKSLMTKNESKLIICSEEYDNMAKIIGEELDVAYCILDHSFITPRNQVPTNLNKFILVFENRVMIENSLTNDFYTNRLALNLCKLMPDGQLKTYLQTHKRVAYQIKCEQDAWNFSSADVVMNMLPLYHMHHSINAVLCSGGAVVLPYQLDDLDIWNTLVDVKETLKQRINNFVAMPDTYAKLIAAYEKHFATDARMAEYVENYCKHNIRTMVSGFAPLPFNVFMRWKEITGQPIIEEYGRIDTGPVMANTKENATGPGIVGRPLPGIDVRLVSKSGAVLHEISKDVKEKQANTALGALEVYGLGVISPYCVPVEQRPTVFSDKYLRTQDLALYDNGLFTIMGRLDTDIIHVANRSVYSPEVESFISTHPDIERVLVGGISDPTWGERVSAVCVLKPNATMDLPTLKSYCSKNLPSYKIPTRLKIVKELPETDLTKSNRKEIMQKFFEDKYHD